ncbi:MAG: hypothetical protein MAG431_00789 [Chloroflexi bacterium]|nr:hypothetical protein [Chloroflexota bacterium]
MLVIADSSALIAEKLRNSSIYYGDILLASSYSPMSFRRGFGVVFAE